jgi:hypothetical protein
VTSGVTARITIGIMSEDLPFHHPQKKPKARTLVPGEHIWTLSKDSRTLRCELRNHSAVEAGWDLQLFDRDGLLSTTRYPLETIARAVAANI